MILNIFLFVLAALTIATLLYRKSPAYKNKTAASFRKLADELKLQFQEGKNPSVRGLLGETKIPTHIFMASVESAGTIAKDCIFIELEMPKDTPHQKMEIHHKDFFDSLYEGIGLVKNIDTGDVDFDKTFMLSAKDPIFVRQLLMEASLRKLFLAEEAFFKHPVNKLFIQDNFVRLRIYGNINEEQDYALVKRMLPLVVGVYEGWER